VTAAARLFRSLLPEVMRSLFGIGVPPLALDPRPGSAGDLPSFAGAYAWPERRIEVAATDADLLISEHGDTVALPVDDRAFLVDPADPDTPTVTFGAFDEAGHPQVLYEMLWGLPRVEE